MNLAVADMLVGLFFTPQYVFMHLFTHPDGVTGTVLCRLLTGSNVAWVGAATSVFTLVVIAIERYSAVLDPFGKRGRLTSRKLKVTRADVYRMTFHKRIKQGAHDMKLHCIVTRKFQNRFQGILDAESSLMKSSPYRSSFNLKRGTFVYLFTSQRFVKMVLRC